ncbi:MAG: nuclear transport factor 2 family protein [Cytophagales bacterium]|nr:nuclear transport factor 2 family protein [Cytophagales bacterium]MDW8384956.1 hypothetical protein [Flammeovirgaceae bacterium]
MTKYLNTICLLLFITLAWAQNKNNPKSNTPTKSATSAPTAPTETPDEKALREEFEKFVKAYQTILTHKDPKSVMRFMSPALKSCFYTSGITDKMKLIEGTLADFENHLLKLIRTEGMSMTYAVDKILLIKTRENTGNLVYTVNFETRINGAIWSKGFETVMLIYRKIDGDWKIIHFTSLNIEDEKEKGVCQSEFYLASETGNYMTKTTIPSGRGYTTNVDNFAFTMANQERIILVGDTAYKWKPLGEIWLQKEGKVGEYSDVLFIGKAHTLDKEDAIMLILRNMYKDNCSEIKFLNKKQ